MTVSTFAASSMPPAFPERAAWGTAQSLRAWQQQALEAYFGTDGQQPGPRDFLTVATPGAGKTTFALRLARELIERMIVAAITIVCPTEHLKRQWAESAARVGIRINPEYQNGDGPVGKARLHLRAEDGVLATRELFDASPPMLKGFEPVRGFAF